MSSDCIIREIRALGASVGSKLDHQTAKLDSLTAKLDSLIGAQNGTFDSLMANLDRLTANIESLRRMVIVLIVLLTLLAFMGFLAFIGRTEPASDPCLQIKSSQAFVRPRPSAAEHLAPAGEPPAAQTGGRPERPTAGGEPRRGGGAQLQ